MEQPVKIPPIEEAPQLPREQKDEVPREEYGSVRDRIKTGDIFLYKGRASIRPLGLVALATRWLTGSPYTHAGMAIWWHDRLMVIESIGRGVVVDPCSMSFQRQKSDVDWFSYSDKMSDETRNDLIIHAQEQLGKRFAFWKAFLALISVKLGLPLERLDEYEEERRLYCSHFVANAYNSVGHDLKKELADEDMTPKDLAESAKLQQIACIFRSPESGRPYDATRPRHSEIRKKDDAA